jgi:hypothetical protein
MEKVIMATVRTLLVALVFCSPLLAAEELVFSDDFAKDDLKTRWTTGSTCEENTIKVVAGRIQATRNCNFIESKQEFTGDLRVEVDVEKDGPSFHGCWDFYIELTGASGEAGVIRFDYDTFDGFAIGMAGEGCGDKVHRPASSPNKGKAVLTFSAPYVSFTFVDANGKSTTVGSAYAGDLTGPSRLRIWLAAHPDTPRYLDNVKVYKLK